MPGFEITPEEVKSMGAKMKTYANAMTSDLDDISARMNMVPNSYRGAASDEITQSKKSCWTKFINYW